MVEVSPAGSGNLFSGPNQESTRGLVLDDLAFKQILETYKSTLVVPEKISSRPQFFLCPIGRVGAGKTTVLKPLASHFHLVRVSTDEIRILLKKHGYSLVRTLEMAYEVIREFAQAGHSLAIDADCVGQRISQGLKQLAEQVGAKIIWIHINPPDEFIFNKLKNYPHGELFNNVEEAMEAYSSRVDLHKNLDFPFAFVFDTSRADVTAQVDKAIVVIENKFRT